jgi:PmbA protein
VNEDYISVVEHVLKLARERGAEEAEVMLGAGRNFSAAVRLGEIERVQEAATRTLGLRVFKDGRSANRYTADLTPRGLAAFVDKTLDLLQIADRDPAAALPEFEEWPEPQDLQLYDPAVEMLTAEEKIERALRAEQAALDFDPRITNSGGAGFSTTAHEMILVNSRGYSGRYNGTVASISVQAIADDAEGKKRNDYWFSVERHANRLLDPVEVGRIAAERTLRHLGAIKVPTRPVPVVWDPDSAMSLVGLVGGAANGELLHRRSSYLVDKEGQRVASPLVSIIDDPLLPARTGSRPFDDEGVGSRRNPLLVDGVFQSFLFDTYTANQCGRRSTGSSERSVGGAPSVGCSNLVMRAGASDPEEIIASVEDGLYLTSMIGHGVNLTDGTFSRGAGGMWIEKGKLAYPVSEINISGNLLEMLAGISMVGNDLAWRGSIAAPTLKIDRMMVSGL